MSTVILQNVSTQETRAVRTAAMIMDNMTIVTSSLDDLATHKQLLENQAMPVGSVEFVREAMQIARIEEPPSITYPKSLTPYLCRSVKQRQAGSVIGNWFVKPVQTKLFTGFVFDTMQEREQYNEHDREQYDAYMSLTAETPVWVSEPVSWLAEWRYYVAHGAVVGRARYDAEGTDAAPVPDELVVRNCIADFGVQHPYALDVGILSTGETALVEVNDAWAIGLYGQALAPRDYLYFLRSRWRSIFQNPA